MDLRPDRDDHPTAETTAAHAPAWTAATPAAAATAPHAPIWTGAQPAVAEATAAHLPIWTDATPVPHAAEQSEESVDDAEVPTFQLSMTAVLASAGAAVCAAILGSQLGIAGTLLGAALGSVVSMTAAAVFSHSLRVARNQLHRTIVTGGSLRLRPALAGVGGSAAVRHEHVATTRLASTRAHDRSASSVSTPIHRASTGASELPPPDQRAWGQIPDPAGSIPARSEPGAIPTTTSIERPNRRRRTVWALAGGTLAGFALAIVALTGYEMISGTPVSGGDQGGLSVLGGGTTGTPDTGSVEDPEPSGGADSSSSSSSSTAGEETTVTSTTTVTATDSSTSSTPSTSSSSSTSATTTDSATSSSGSTGTIGGQTGTTTTTPTPTGGPPAG